MESAMLTQTCINRMEGVHASCIRKILVIKSTYSTKRLDTSIPTVTNKEVLHRANMLPIYSHIHNNS